MLILSQLMRSAYFRRPTMQFTQRWFATMKKKKFAVSLRYKDGRQLAMEHFDFYYKPIFKSRWPSIRLGLMSRSKKCAIINNYGFDSSSYCEQFEATGARNLVVLLEEARERRINEGKPLDKNILPQNDEREMQQTNVDVDVEDRIIELDNRRSAATMNEFIQPTRYITRDTTPKSHREDVRPPELETWNSEDVQFLFNDDIVYPKHLRVYVYPLGDVSKIDHPITSEEHPVLGYQVIDAAALFPVLALDVRPNETVLDLCASPGEKALALLQTLTPCDLVCNDLPGRINLLKHNLHSYVQRNDDVRSRIRFLRVDASHLREDNVGIYHKVLVDVPNAEDRKNLRMDDDDGNLFRRSMSTERLQLPDQQTDILIGGLKALRRDGVLVYTTSTLSPNQNDEVVETALRRLSQDPESEELEFAVCDLEPLALDFYNAQVLRFARRQCRYGQLVIPFLPNNYGPVYACKLKRVG